ncbi:MAG TPA: 50S ribosomal protein L18Ae [archaeon]|nr:50S ribosomal protein L18Ae [archaeon]
MVEKVFTIAGTYAEKSGEKKFTKEMSAINQNFAREKVLSQIGSKHGVLRNAIKIASITERKE